MHVDHHDIDTGIGGEALQMVQLLRVVNKGAGLLVVGLLKVLGRDFQRLGHALADCNARHHYDELAPAVLFVQLENRLDVAIGLASPRFHLDIKI